MGIPGVIEIPYQSMYDVTTSIVQFETFPKLCDLVENNLLIYQIWISVLPLNIALDIKGINVNFEIHSVANCYERVPESNELIR